jgi:hypothetical protein
LFGLKKSVNIDEGTSDNGTQTLDEHIGNKKNIKQVVPDLFSDYEIEKKPITGNKFSSHLVNNYTIFANGNYSGNEFDLPGK